MSVQTSCPNCQAKYTLPDEKVGKKVKCKKCEEAFTVSANGNGKANGHANGGATMTVTCPHCEAVSKIQRAFSGERIKCKKCGKAFAAVGDDEMMTKASNRAGAPAGKSKGVNTAKKDEADGSTVEG